MVLAAFLRSISLALTCAIRHLVEAIRVVISGSPVTSSRSPFKSRMASMASFCRSRETPAGFRLMIGSPQSGTARPETVGKKPLDQRKPPRPRTGLQDDEAGQVFDSLPMP